MPTAPQQSGNRWKPRLAVFAAAILLLAQSLGAAHFHPLQGQQKYAADTAGSADSGLCAVCLVRVHSPTVSSVVPNLAAPALFRRTVVFAVQSQSHSACDSHLFGRAPPASI